MSAMAVIAFAAFGALVLWGIGIGIRGALAEAPPYMKGEGQVGRFDARLKKTA